MPRTPFQAQSRYEGAHRPWNLTKDSAQRRVKNRKIKFATHGMQDEIQACLSCPLPDCKSEWCPILRDLRKRRKQKESAAHGS